MNYLQWNNLIGGMLFDEKNRGRLISLVITSDELAVSARTQWEIGDEIADEDIIVDFKNAWITGIPRFARFPSMIEKIREECKWGDDFHRRDKAFFQEIGGVEHILHYPPALAHLVGVLMAISDNREHKSRYSKITSYFGLAPYQFQAMTETDNWNRAWDRLFWWANTYKEGGLGLLPERSLSSQRFAYMGKPYTYLLLSNRQVQDFYRALFAMDQEPNTSIADRALLEAYAKVIKKGELLNFLNSESWSEDKGIILSILRTYYQQWEGDVELEEEGGQRFYQSRKLRLCFSIDREGYAEFCFRFQDSLFTDSSLRLNGQDIEIFPNQWSSPLKFDNSFAKHSYRDDRVGLKVVFSPVESRFFIFCKGDKEGLDPTVLIESQHIQPTGRQFLLVRKEMTGDIGGWIADNGGKAVTEDILQDGLIEDWDLFRFDNGFSAPLELGTAKLGFPMRQSLSYTRGLSGREPGEFICGYPLEMVLDGALGNEKLLLSGMEGKLELPISAEQHFIIPVDIACDTYILSIVPQDHNIYIPYGGILKIAKLDASDSDQESNAACLMPAVICQEERNNFQVARNLLSNLRQHSSSPPQFAYWSAAEMNLSSLSDRSRAAIDLLEYLCFVPQLNTGSFELSIYQIYSGNAGVKDHKNFSRYTLNALREGSRITIQRDPKGRAQAIQAIVPFLVQLGNFQNFPIPLWIGMKAFDGCLYALCGCYSVRLLEVIEQLCTAEGGELKIFREESENALLPPSVYLYEPKGKAVATRVLELIGQPAGRANYEYMVGLPNFDERIGAVLAQSDYNLHVASRWKVLDLSKFSFQDAMGNTFSYPSLSQYQVEPWKWHFVLRLNVDGFQHNREIEPRMGKYLLFQATGFHILAYNKSNNSLLVPAYFRLPEEIERNLFFHTGRLPQTLRLSVPNENNPSASGPMAYLVYSGVLKKAAEKIAVSLGQKLNTLEKI